MTSGAGTDILLVTATTVETTAVLEAFGIAARQANPQGIDGRVYFDLGTVNGSRVRMTRSEMGAGGLGASLQSVGKGIAALSPKAVVMVGIAFGMNEKKQSIGDVLVSEQLRLYDLQRVGTGEDGRVQVILRDDKPHASPWLLNLFKSSEVTWDGAALRFGTILAGAKLVDNLDFRGQLQDFEPEAIGGEMEGAGLYVACHEQKVDWILVKAICDFADGQKGKDKAKRQALAAKNAAAFIYHALQFAKTDWGPRLGSSSGDSRDEPMQIVQALNIDPSREREGPSLSGATDHSVRSEPGPQSDNGMLLSILHLSDLHIASGRDLVLSKADAIAATTSGGTQGTDLWVILLSGDIASSGRTEQYSLAEEFVGRLRNRLSSLHPLSQIEVILVPGNHDCNFELDNGVRRLLLQQIIGAPDAVDHSVVAQCLGVQAPFFQFMHRIEGSVGLSEGAAIIYHRDFAIGGSLVRFNCYNTAWVSQKHEKQGDLTFPTVPHINLPAPDVVVSVLHHHLAWLKADNRRRFQSHLERTSDLIVTGHEHQPGQFQKLDLTGEAVEYCEGGALQIEGSSSESEFNILHVDCLGRRHKFAQYQWSEGRYIRKAAYRDWKPFVHGAERRAGLAFTDEFEQFLSDPGAQFTHPHREHLVLDDIFVYPDLRELRIPPTNRKLLDIFGGKQISDRLGKDLRKVVVYGADASGKTTLAKRWCRELAKRHVAAIMLPASALSSADPETLERVIRKHELQQHGPMRAEMVAQLPAEHRAVLVDDFQRRSANRKQVLDALGAAFGTIVLFGSELLKFQELSYGDDVENNPFVEYERFEIMPFGHVRKSRLIERWYDMSRQAGVELNTLAKKVRETRAAIDMATRNDVVPSYPLFLLIIIQTYEAMSPADSPAASSRSYGYFHEVLITRALTQPDAPADIDTSYKYLSELAYHMFASKARRMSEGELRERHAVYCQDYMMSLSFERVLLFLERTGVLQMVQGNQYAFKYKYLYHYFVARALAHDSMRFEGDCPRLIAGLHREESTSILMFLVYFARDEHERVVSRMLAKARELYQQATRCDLDGDVALFSAMNVAPEPMLLPASSAEENRQELLEARDSVRSTSMYEDEDDGEGEDDSSFGDVDEVVKINAALKTIQVLGQIVRSFPGSTRRPLKLEIVGECYSLGLRAMNSLLSVLKDNKTALCEEVAVRLRTTGVDEREVGGRAESMIYWLSEILVLTFVLKTSEAVGLNQLEPTYDELLRADGSLGYALIDLAVRLEHFASFPENKIDALIRRTKDVAFTRGILTRLVYRHFYLYETDRRILQRFSAKLKIRRATPESWRLERRTRGRTS